MRRLIGEGKGVGKGKGEREREGEEEKKRQKSSACPFRKAARRRDGEKAALSLKGTFAFAYSLGTSCPTQRVDMLCKIYKGQGQGVPVYQQAGHREGIHVLRLRL